MAGHSGKMVASAILAALGTAYVAAVDAAGTMSTGSFVGQWTCNGAESPVNGAFQSVVSIYPNGTWAMQMMIAPIQNRAGGFGRASGNYQQTGAGALALNTLEQYASLDGVNWGRVPPTSMAAQLNGNSGIIGGASCHRSG